MVFYWHSQEGQSKREKETGKQYPGSSLAAHSTEQTFSVRVLMYPCSWALLVPVPQSVLGGHFYYLGASLLRFVSNS